MCVSVLCRTTIGSYGNSNLRQQSFPFVCDVMRVRLLLKAPFNAVWRNRVIPALAKALAGEMFKKHSHLLRGFYLRVHIHGASNLSRRLHCYA